MLFLMSKVQLREVKSFVPSSPGGQGYIGTQMCVTLPGPGCQGFLETLVPLGHMDLLWPPGPFANRARPPPQPLPPVRAPGCFVSEPPLDSCEEGAWRWPQLERWHQPPDTLWLHRDKCVPQSQLHGV